MPTCLQCGAKVEAGVAACAACGLPMPGAPLAGVPNPPPSAAQTSPSAGVPAAPVAATASPAMSRGLSRVIVGVCVLTVLGTLAAIGIPIYKSLTDPPITPPITQPPVNTITPPVVEKVTPPPTDPQPKTPAVPITTPAKGSAVRQAMMDEARVALQVEGAFTVVCLYLQGDNAVGILIPAGTQDRVMVLWSKIEGRWDVGVTGPPGGAEVVKTLRDPAFGYSPEILAKVGL
jgi:hypothetical protein